MLIAVVFAVLSVLCVLYYLLMVTYAGIGTSFAPAWLVAFVFFALIAVFQFLDYRKIIPVLTWVRYVIWGIVLACFALFFVLEGMVISGMTSKPENKLDYIIVMGAQVRGDVPSKSLLRRIEVAADYLLDNPDTVAIVSGGKGNGENISEAQCMYNYLLDYGIEAERIIMEDKATSTEENIELSMEIIKERSQEDVSIGIVTNNFHIFRTIQVCSSRGYDVSGIPAKSDEILLLNYMVREAFAILQYKITGVI